MRNPIEWLMGIPSQEEVDALHAEWAAKTHHVPDDADREDYCVNCGEPIHHRPKYDFWQHSAVRVGIYCDDVQVEGAGGIMLPSIAKPQQ